MTLDELFRQVVYFPHPEARQGRLHIAEDAVDPEWNCCISPGARLDMTGDISIGAYCMIGEGTRILTHDHHHYGLEPLLELQKRVGVWWKDKVIGRDVWLHGCTVLAQVTHIPDGVVVGAGAVLTKIPGPYEIWAGNPSRKIGERKA
jgi:acetyltransferase-like isoleucine patch superfamily enzyme